MINLNKTNQGTEDEAALIDWMRELKEDEKDQPGLGMVKYGPALNAAAASAAAARMIAELEGDEPPFIGGATQREVDYDDRAED